MGKKDGCKNNPSKSSTTKVEEPIPCGYLMPTMWVFNGMKLSTMYVEVKVVWNCESLREHSLEIINFGIKKMIALSEKELWTCTNHENCHTWTEKFKEDADDEKYYWRSVFIQ